MHADEDAIRQLVATWLDASRAGDTDKVLGLMTDDVVFLTPGHPPMRGKAAFADSQASLKSFGIQARGEIEEVRIFGDWAWMWTRLVVTMTPKSGGPPVERAGNTLSILTKRAGAWMIVRDANMLAPVGE
ncbi:MAG: SgcJ/EcaC family oxidoreductase [Betaproteobacteria bacterium]